MSESKDMVPLSQAAYLERSTAFRDVVLKNIQEIRQDPNLTLRQKRDMIRSEFTGLIQARKLELDTKVRTQDYKLHAEESVARRAIDAYKNKLMFQIDDDFNEVMRKLGIKVVMKKLNLLVDIGEKLSAFEDTLKAKKNMKKKFADAILAEADKTFEAVSQQLGKNVADSIVEVTPERPGKE